MQQIDDALTDAESLISEIQNDLVRLDGLGIEQRPGLESTIERKLSALDNSINKMGGSVNSLPADQRDYYNGEIGSIRSSYSKLLTELRQKRQALASNPAYKQNQQLQSNVQKSNQIIDNLDEAISVGNQTITTSNTIMGTLSEDRNMIENINNNLNEIDAQGKVGESRAKAMLKRAILNKVLAWVIVVILLALLGFTLYWKISRGKKETK